MRYNYDQYLEQWHRHFGDAPQGNFVYWQSGKRKTKILPKMSREQFVETLGRFDTLSPKIDRLQKRDDYATNDGIANQVDKLLAESFECELPLFF